MRKTVYLGVILGVLVGCTSVVHKKWSVIGGSKADATVRLAFEYAELEEPRENRAEAQRLAVKRCQAWGYRDATPFDMVTRNCISGPGIWSDCSRYRVSIEYQCID